MAIALKKEYSLKLADEVFLVVATLHQENLEKDDFTVQEIMDKANELRLNGTIRAGFVTHVRMHCVANMAPNPGDYRMLFASGKSRRRLLMKPDQTNRQRNGKIFPDLRELDPKYFALVTWARERYEASGENENKFAELLALAGSGKEIWADEHADEYIDRLRSDWD